MSGSAVVVVGAGLAGAAAAWRLAERGRQVLLVESIGPAHGGGSSHGSARIFRHAYPDAFWVGLTVEALEGWRHLERLSGEALLTVTGGLDLGSRREIGAIEHALDAHGLPHETVTAAGARQRWPWLAADGPVLHQPGAGVIDAERAVRTMIRLAAERGAEVLLGDPVVGVDEDGAGVAVRTAAGRTAWASAVVIAAGAWLPELLPVLPPAVRDRVPALAVTEQQVFHFRFPPGTRDDRPWPVFVDEGHRSVYALPGGRDAGHAGFKIAEHDVGIGTTASGRAGRLRAEARERIVDYVRATLPTVDATPYAETTCLYTRTADEEFVIDRAGRTVVASPCSGHGAKFAPVIGSMIADAVDGRIDAVPDRFRRGAGPSGAAALGGARPVARR